MISIKNLNKIYTNEQISVHVLKDINIQITAKNIYFIRERFKRTLMMKLFIMKMEINGKSLYFILMEYRMVKITILISYFFMLMIL